jgi:hypothetical protein
MESRHLLISRSNFYLLLVCFIGASFALSGQDISFVAEAPNVIRAGEQFQLTYTLSDDADEFTPPDFGDFKYLGGPSTGSSTSISMINGRTTRTSSYTFTYYLQAPAKAGKYALGPATAKYKRQEVKSNSLNIEIVSSGQSGSTGTNQSNQSAPGATSSTADGNIYVRLEYDKNTAYVGEQITAWVKLYTQVSITAIDPQFKGPEFVGFYQQDVEITSPISLQREKVGNDIYSTAVIKKVVLYPQKPGEVTIDPFDLIVEVQKQSRRRSQSIFDDFFGPQYERARVNLSSNRVKFTIKPLPAGQPAEFTGAVGKFQMSGSANLKQVKTNDAITFAVAITGKGNLKLIDNVQAEFPPAFDVFDPIRKVQFDNNSMGKSGKVSFEYTAIPRHAGNFTIPPFKLVYFDPELQRYNTLSTQSFDINVEKGEGDSTTVVAGNLSKEDIELLGSDIRYIDTETILRPKSGYIFGSTGFFAFYFVLALLFFTILIIRKERIKRSADIARYKNRRAGRIANKRLKKAQALLKSNMKKEFYDELEQALWIYLSDKLSIPFSELSKERAGEEFEKRNIPDGLAFDFFNLIQSCEYARYAPGGLESEMSDMLHQSAQILNKLDQKL